MEKVFAGQTVVISGGIGDIGFATALEFAKLGAHIALCGLNPESESEPSLQALNELGVASSYRQVDVADAKAVEAWVTEVEKTMGIATIIIANAATVTHAGILEISSEQWSRELRVNLDGAFYLTRFAVSRLVEKKLPGRVVFVGSWAGTKVHKHIPAYSVSKAGLNMLSKCMALELAPHQILVNEIAPGYVAAGLTGRAWKDLPGEQEKSTRLVPIHKVINAREVAEQIIYLCHPANTHMTGSTLLMDGGLSLL
jgi:glucose 1-dehydrogenase